jgi:FkbM family methyltransferase
VTPAFRVGEADRFRSGSWLERSVDRLRRGQTAAAPPMLRRAFEALLDWLPGDHLVSQLPDGERVRLSARYRHLSWNPDEYRAFRAAVRPGVTVLDVGANVGAYTLMFAMWVGEGGRVYAFEPAPDARAGLRTHVALNGLDARVEIVESAMSSSAGSAPFALHPSGGASSLSLSSVADAFHVVVDTDTIDNFCRTRALSPSVIKIDVEGSELDVLKGARHTLALPGMHAFVEFHPAAWALAGIAPAEIEHELREQGFVAEPLDPAYDPWATEGVSVRLRRR